MNNLILLYPNIILKMSINVSLKKRSINIEKQHNTFLIISPRVFMCWANFYLKILIYWTGKFDQRSLLKARWFPCHLLDFDDIIPI